MASYSVRWSLFVCLCVFLFALNGFNNVNAENEETSKASEESQQAQAPSDPLQAEAEAESIKNQKESLAVPVTSFSFRDYFLGEWEIYTSSLSPVSGSVEHNLAKSYYFISKQNSSNSDYAGEGLSQNLVGFAYDNDTQTSTENNIKENPRSFFIEFYSSNSGSFRVSPSIDSGVDENNYKVETSETVELFKFFFHYDHQTHIAVSTGPWKNLVVNNNNKDNKNEGKAKPGEAVGDNSFYHFTVVSHDKFSITVNTGNSELILFSGRRVIRPEEKTFFQKYGTFVMLGAFFIFNIWSKTRSASANQFSRSGQAERLQQAQTRNAEKANNPSGQLTGTVTSKQGSAKKHK